MTLCNAKILSAKGEDELKFEPYYLLSQVSPISDVHNMDISGLYLYIPDRLNGDDGMSQLLSGKFLSRFDWLEEYRF